RVGAAHPTFGKPTTYDCEQHLKLLAARIENELPHVFDRYPPLRLRPFTFLAQKQDLITSIREGRKFHPLLSTFSIRPRYALDAKLVEPRDGDVFVGLFATVNLRYEIKAPLDVLERARIPLNGLYVVWRD